MVHSISEGLPSVSSAVGGSHVNIQIRGSAYVLYVCECARVKCIYILIVLKTVF